MNVGERDLWSACVAGDRTAFEILVQTHQSLVFSVGYALTGSRQAAEDIAQETFLQAWAQRARLRDPLRLKAWLCGIARNLGINTTRRTREVPMDSPEPVACDRLEAEVVERELAELVWRTLETIPPTYREPLVLYYRMGQSIREVADALGLEVATVEQRLSRGRKYLRSEVEELVERGLRDARPRRDLARAVVAALPVSIPERAAFTRTGVSMKIVVTAVSIAGMSAIVAWNPLASSGPTTEPAQPGVSVSADAEIEPLQPAATPDAPPTTSKTAPGPAGPRHPSASNTTTLPRAYELARLSDRQVGVDLDGGPTEVPPQDTGSTPKPAVVRWVEGRVVDSRGRAVPGVVVMVGRFFAVTVGRTLLSDEGTTTDAHGRFKLPITTDGRVRALALHRKHGWSAFEIVEAGDDDASVTLRLGPPARLRVTTTRGGEPTASSVRLQSPRERGYSLAFASDAKGIVDIPALPPAAYTLLVAEGTEPVQSARPVVREIQLEPGRTMDLSIALPIGAFVAVEAEPHRDREIVRFELIPGRHHPTTSAELKQLKRSIDSDIDSRIQGGDDHLIAEFADLPGGAYTACVQGLRPDGPVGALVCRHIEVGDNENAAVRIPAPR